VEGGTPPHRTTASTPRTGGEEKLAVAAMRVLGPAGEWHRGRGWAAWGGRLGSADH
jgi:hypothetical protein